MKNEELNTTLVNVAVIVIGSYHLPASVAFGALVGASLFILSKTGYAPLPKAWLFAVSFFCGVFGGADAANIMNWIFPDKMPLRVNDFTGAVMSSAFAVVLVQAAYRFLERSQQEIRTEQQHE